MATVPVQSAVAVGQRNTATLHNDDVVDAVNFLLQEPYALPYQSAGQTLTTSVWAAVALASEEADTDVMHDNATNNSRVVAKTAGLYLVCAQAFHTAVNTTGNRQAQVRKNAAGAVGSGTSVLILSRDANPSASLASMNVGHRLIALAANDYLEMFAFQSSGGNNTLVAGADSTFLHMVRLYS